MLATLLCFVKCYMYDSLYLCTVPVNVTNTCLKFKIDADTYKTFKYNIKCIKLRKFTWIHIEMCKKACNFQLSTYDEEVISQLCQIYYRQKMLYDVAFSAYLSQLIVALRCPVYDEFPRLSKKSVKRKHIIQIFITTCWHNVIYMACYISMAQYDFSARKISKMTKFYYERHRKVVYKYTVSQCISCIISNTCSSIMIEDRYSVNDLLLYYNSISTNAKLTKWDIYYIHNNLNQLQIKGIRIKKIRNSLIDVLICYYLYYTSRNIKQLDLLRMVQIANINHLIYYSFIKNYTQTNNAAVQVFLQCAIYEQYKINYQPINISNYLNPYFELRNAVILNNFTNNQLAYIKEDKMIHNNLFVFYLAIWTKSTSLKNRKSIKHLLLFTRDIEALRQKYERVILKLIYGKIEPIIHCKYVNLKEFLSMHFRFRLCKEWHDALYLKPRTNLSDLIGLYGDEEFNEYEFSK